MWLIAAAGLALTVALTVAAYSAHSENEDRLIEQHTREAAAVISAAVPRTQATLEGLARLVNAVGGTDQPTVRDAMQELVDEGTYVSVTVGPTNGNGAIVTAGAPPKHDDVGDLLSGNVVPQRADGPAGLHVIGLLRGDDPRIGYLYGSGSTAVYAEAVTPPDRMSRVSPNQAFSGLDHALYLGPTEDIDQLIFSTETDLPITGRRAQELVPFGDSSILLVMAPNGELGGHLLARLPWLVLGAGVVSTILGSALVSTIWRRQRRAEALSAEIEQLYSRERRIAHTLQQSLLPSELPTIPGVEVAARYVAGAVGTEVGGDWYDVIDAGDNRLVVIVGDVAGRGVQAASVMAAMRYSTHALAAHGTSPTDVLTKVNRLDGIRGDFVTMVCGVIDLENQTVLLSRAGHPSPLLVAGADTRFLTGPIGPPVGFLDDAEYRSDATELAPGATLLLFTDGLYERKGESVDVGLERLRTVAAEFDGRFEDLIDHVYQRQVGEESRDDVAMLAIHLTPVPAAIATPSHETAPA